MITITLEASNEIRQLVSQLNSGVEKAAVVKFFQFKSKAMLNKLSLQSEMSEKDFQVVCSKIDEEQKFLDSVSRDIWEHPELGLKEIRAHQTLTSAIKLHGFQVQEKYLLPTAFRAKYSSSAGGPTIAILLEYDALPDIGHACGHNLIAEAGLAAALGVKAAMEADDELRGELLVLGTPAEENAGGKISLMNAGAFEGVDAAMMVHPTNFTTSCPKTLSRMSFAVNFKGKEAHASASPWQGRNALDAAVSAYNNIAMLRQQVKPDCKIHAILTRGGTVTNIIPRDARLELSVRASTSHEMEALFRRTKECVEAGARAAGCEAEIDNEGGSHYASLITNRVMGDIYKEYAEKLGLKDNESTGSMPVGSTDMGNVSHLLPSIHPLYALPSPAKNHTREFTGAAGAPDAQPPTLVAAKAMALTAVALMRRPGEMRRAKECHDANQDRI